MHASYTAGITTRAHTSILHMRIPGLLPTPAKAWSTIFPLAAKFLQFMVEQNAVSVLRRFSLEDLLSQGHATYQDTARILLGMYNSGEERRFRQSLLERARAREADRKTAGPFIVAAMQSDWSASSLGILRHGPSVCACVHNCLQASTNIMRLCSHFSVSL